MAKYHDWLTPDGLTLLTGWARDGLTMDQIAHNMGIATCTLMDWKNRFPEVSDALKRGKEVVDMEVESALLKRAMGYDYNETKTEMIGDDVVKTTVTVKHIAPDVTAQIYWLKNRMRGKWTDGRQTQEDNNTGGVILIPEAADDG